MCGIVGMVGVSAVNQRIYDALTVLQHRGQDAAGIMTSESGELFMRKDSGLVRDVFQQKHMLKLKGNMGIGHVRYPTAGADSAHDAQPFYVNSPYGICLGHNGNASMAKYMSTTEFIDFGAVTAFGVAAMFIPILKQCGDDLSRENIMRQAANLKDLELPMLLPGIKVNTSPDNYYPIRRMQLASFNGESWEQFGDVLSG